MYSTRLTPILTTLITSVTSATPNPYIGAKFGAKIAEKNVIKLIVLIFAANLTKIISAFCFSTFCSFVFLFFKFCESPFHLQRETKYCSKVYVRSDGGAPMTNSRRAHDDDNKCFRNQF